MTSEHLDERHAVLVDAIEDLFTGDVQAQLLTRGAECFEHFRHGTKKQRLQAVRTLREVIEEGLDCAGRFLTGDDDDRRELAKEASIDLVLIRHLARQVEIEELG